MIIKKGNKWLLIVENTGKILGRHPSRKAAEKQERIIKARK